MEIGLIWPNLVQMSTDDLPIDHGDFLPYQRDPKGKLIQATLPFFVFIASHLILSCFLLKISILDEQIQKSDPFYPFGGFLK